MIARDARMRVALSTKKLCHGDDVQNGSMEGGVAATYDCAYNEKGFMYYWNLTTIHPKMKSTNSSWKSYAFKRNKSDASSSSSLSSASQMEETQKSQDEMEIYRGCYA